MQGIDNTARVVQMEWVLFLGFLFFSHYLGFQGIEQNRIDHYCWKGSPTIISSICLLNSGLIMLLRASLFGFYLHFCDQWINLLLIKSTMICSFSNFGTSSYREVQWEIFRHGKMEFPSTCMWQKNQEVKWFWKEGVIFQIFLWEFTRETVAAHAWECSRPGWTQLKATWPSRRSLPIQTIPGVCNFS